MSLMCQCKEHACGNENHSKMSWLNGTIRRPKLYTCSISRTTRIDGKDGFANICSNLCFMGWQGMATKFVGSLQLLCVDASGCPWLCCCESMPGEKQMKRNNIIQ